MKEYPITLIEITTEVNPKLPKVGNSIEYKGWLCTRAIDGCIMILKDVTFDEQWVYYPNGEYVEEQI